MSIKNFLPAVILSLGLALTAGTPATAAPHHHRKVVYKHKTVHHKHRIGLRHIGRGTKTTTKVKVEH